MAALVLKPFDSSSSWYSQRLDSFAGSVLFRLFFVFSFINMFGVPLKPPAIAMFLLMGLSPMNTLILVLAMAVVSPMAGGIQVLRSGLYHGKIALAQFSLVLWERFWARIYSDTGRNNADCDFVGYYGDHGCFCFKA